MLSHEPLMRITQGTKSYGGVHALSDVTIDFPKGSITGIVGPNGAGKTTLLNVLSGHTSISRGEIVFDGRSVSGLRAYQRARLGLSRTFQNLEINDEMSILDSTMMGAYERARRKDPDLGRFGSRTKTLSALAVRALNDCGIEGDGSKLPGELSYGQQKIVEIARALMSNAKMVLLDEPFAGLSPDERIRVAGLVSTLRESGVTIAIIDHDVQMIFGLVDTVTVLNFGIVIAQGSPDEVGQNKAVVEAYLGVDE